MIVSVTGRVTLYYFGRHTTSSYLNTCKFQRLAQCNECTTWDLQVISSHWFKMNMFSSAEMCLSSYCALWYVTGNITDPYRTWSLYMHLRLAINTICDSSFHGKELARLIECCTCFSNNANFLALSNSIENISASDRKQSIAITVTCI